MKKRQWTQIDLHWGSSTDIEIDDLIGWLTLFGFEGSQDISEADRSGLRFFVPPSQSAKKLLSDIQVSFKTRFGSDASGIQYETESIDEVDWMEEWKKHFDVLPISDHVVVCPSWKTYVPKKNEIVILMDPGMAFGTGHHASTQLILQTLESHLGVFLSRGVAPTVLDVGTGTGILSIAAVKLGASKVLANDVDVEALQIAEENIQQNSVQNKVELTSLTLEHLRRKFHLIVANIIAEVHVPLLPYYGKRLEEDGVLVLSGIIQERIDWVVREAQKVDLVLWNKQVQGEWVCLTFIRERRRSQR